MSAYRFLGLLIALCIFCLAMVVAIKLADAHDWYTGTRDPVTNGGCCGGSDCAILAVTPGVIEAVDTGYRLRLSAAQAKAINPARNLPVDTLILWERVQPSLDGNFHLCISALPSVYMQADFYCFWAPPST